jgi:hypothetical protein
MTAVGHKSQLVELYESAAHVHQVLRRFSHAHNTDPIASLVPEISLIFEQLEHIIVDKTTNRSRKMEDEFENILRRTDAVRRDRVHLREEFHRVSDYF